MKECTCDYHEDVYGARCTFWHESEVCEHQAEFEAQNAGNVAGVMVSHAMLVAVACLSLQWCADILNLLGSVPRLNNAELERCLPVRNCRRFRWACLLEAGVQDPISFLVALSVTVRLSKLRV